MKSEEFEAAVALHREGLARFIAMMVGGEAEEIVQDTVTDALRQLDRFEGRSKFSTWLYSIALNKCRNFLRDRKRHAAPADQEVLEAQPARQS